MIRAIGPESRRSLLEEIARMADGSRSVALEAGAAAAEAAREAKAEALERATTIESAASLPAGKPRTAGRRAQWSEFVVDVWITNFNSIEFGIYKRSRNRAKSRQFTSDMDIFAEVIEKGARTGLLGYREDMWGKNAGMDKRLVMKLFSESLNWRATMDLMIGRSLQQTLGAHGLPVTCFSINASDHDNMIYLERSAHKWPLVPENFSFFLLNDGKPQFYRLKRDFIDLGGDYTLFSHRDEPVGRLDGRVFSIGGKWHGRVHPEHASPKLLTVLKLFCGMLIFNPDCRRHMRRLARDVKHGRFEPKIEKQEADLYMNPRRVR
jgi:hypothetical protein